MRSKSAAVKSHYIFLRHSYFGAVFSLASSFGFSCGNHWEDRTFWKLTPKPVSGQMPSPHFPCSLRAPCEAPGEIAEQRVTQKGALSPSYPSAPTFWEKHTGSSPPNMVRNQRRPERTGLTPFHAWRVRPGPAPAPAAEVCGSSLSLKGPGREYPGKSKGCEVGGGDSWEKAPCRSEMVITRVCPNVWVLTNIFT